MQNFKFSKEERLCSEKLLNELFKNGSSFLFYPFRVTWLVQPSTQQFPVQVVVSVPKKRFKRSVDRNRLKRIIKEAYRLNKASLLYSFLEQKDQNILLALNFVGKEILDYHYVERKMIKMLENLQIQISKS
jgi:ribonuclease P protein component